MRYNTTYYYIILQAIRCIVFKIDDNNIIIKQQKSSIKVCKVNNI
jgi:hypothetical protein